MYRQVLLTRKWKLGFLERPVQRPRPPLHTHTLEPHCQLSHCRGPVVKFLVRS